MSETPMETAPLSDDFSPRPEDPCPRCDAPTCLNNEVTSERYCPECGWVGEPLWEGETGFAQIAKALAAVTEAPIGMEQTGGGCGTIYVGTPDDEGCYVLAIGPGSYDRAAFYLRDPIDDEGLGDPCLVVGPDDQTGDGAVCGTLDEVAAAAMRYLASIPPERAQGSTGLAIEWQRAPEMAP